MPSELISDTENLESQKPRRLRNFVAGFCLSAFPIGYLLWLSTWATQGNFETIGMTKLVVVIAIPCLSGSLAAIWGKPVVDSLGNILEKWPV